VYLSSYAFPLSMLTLLAGLCVPFNIIDFSYGCTLKNKTRTTGTWFQFVSLKTELAWRVLWISAKTCKEGIALNPCFCQRSCGEVTSDLGMLLLDSTAHFNSELVELDLITSAFRSICWSLAWVKNVRPCSNAKIITSCSKPGWRDHDLVEIESMKRWLCWTSAIKWIWFNSSLRNVCVEFMEDLRNSGRQLSWSISTHDFLLRRLPHSAVQPEQSGTKKLVATCDLVVEGAWKFLLRIPVAHTMRGALLEPWKKARSSGKIHKITHVHMSWRPTKMNLASNEETFHAEKTCVQS
jgi:hypothetical protein